MRAGIYLIKGPASRFYVGQSGKIRQRWASHLRDLRAGRHHAPAMQSDFNEYGEESFSFEVALICSHEMLTFYEQSFVDAADPILIYNVRRLCVRSGLGVPASPERRARVAVSLTGIKRSDETRARIGAATRLRQTPEYQAKMSAAIKGFKHSPETRLKMSESKKGKKRPASVSEKRLVTMAARAAERGSYWSPEVSQAIAERNRTRCLGTKASPEHRAKLSAAQTARWAGEART